MHLCSYQLRFQTPAFLGNAQQQGQWQWRTLPFMALLRQLWQRHSRSLDAIFGAQSTAQGSSGTTPSLCAELLESEGKQLELKRDLSSPLSVLKTLVAFANSTGGRLVIGLDDMHQVVGVADPLAEEERICSLISDTIAPRLLPNVELMSVGDTTVLMVEAFPSSARQHYLSKQGTEQGVYVRRGSSNRQVVPDWIAETRRAAAGLVFDEQPMPGLSVQDLDLDAMARWFGPARPLDTAQLQTLKLLRADQGRPGAHARRHTAVGQGTRVPFPRCLGALRALSRAGQSGHL